MLEQTLQIISEGEARAQLQKTKERIDTWTKIKEWWDNLWN